MSALELARITDRQDRTDKQLDLLVGEVQRLQEFVRLLGERLDGAAPEPPVNDLAARRPMLTLGKKKV